MRLLLSGSCGFITNGCRDLKSSGGIKYLFGTELTSADVEAYGDKLVNFPVSGFGKRIQDTRSRKYIGLTTNVTECIQACDRTVECDAATVSTAPKKPGCFLQSKLDQNVTHSLTGEVTYFKTTNREFRVQKHMFSVHDASVDCSLSDRNDLNM